MPVLTFAMIDGQWEFDRNVFQNRQDARLRGSSRLQHVAAMQNLHVSRFPLGRLKAALRIEFGRGCENHAALRQCGELLLSGFQVFVQLLTECASCGSVDAIENRLMLFLKLGELRDRGGVSGLRPDAVSQVFLAPTNRRFDRIESCDCGFQGDVLAVGGQHFDFGEREDEVLRSLS